MHGPELATIVFADSFRQRKPFRALQLAPGTWGGPDGGAAFLEDVLQVTGASWVLWNTFSLFSRVSCTHSILFRAASVRMCGQCWSRQPGFLDEEALLRGRRYRASPGPRGNHLESPLCLEPRQDASCSVRGAGRSHRNSRPSGTAPRGLPPSLAWTSILLRPTAIPRQETRISSAPGQSNLAVPSVQE